MGVKPGKVDSFLLYVIAFIAIVAWWYYHADAQRQTRTTVNATAPSVVSAQQTPEEKKVSEEPNKQRREAGAEIFYSLVKKGATQALFGSMGNPCWVLCIPGKEWKGLTRPQREDLGYFASFMAVTARNAPEAYAGVPRNAPVFDMAMRNMAAMDSGSWGISTTRKGTRGVEMGPFVLAGDSAWAHMDGGAVIRWSDFIAGSDSKTLPPPKPQPQAPDAKNVQILAEVRSRRWLLDRAHDPDSVSIEDRGPFFRHKDGYVQKVKVRAKNAMGAKVLNVFEFHFDGRGNIVDVRQ